MSPPETLVRGLIDDVTRVGDGLVAVGHFACADTCTLAPAGDAERTALWTSPDGRDWTRQPWVADLPPVRTLWAGADRTLGGGQGGIWDLTVPEEWRSVEGDFRAARILDIVEGPLGLVALGLTDASTPVTWTSADGARWDRHDLDLGFGGTQVQQLRRVGERLAIVGPGDGVWWSDDGIAWTPDPIDDFGGILWDIGKVGDHAVVVGQPGIIGQAWRSLSAAP